MTKEQREFHERMNDEIIQTFATLYHEFDVGPADLKPDWADWQILRSDLKGLLLKAYERNHSWISES